MKLYHIYFMYICDTMNLNLLENILSIFYGTKAQCLHFYMYLDMDTLMALIPTCKVFEKQKEYIYKLVIGKIPFLPYPKEKFRFKERCLRYETELKKRIAKIKSNTYLREKKYLLGRTEKCLSNYTTEGC